MTRMTKEEFDRGLKESIPNRGKRFVLRARAVGTLFMGQVFNVEREVGEDVAFMLADEAEKQDPNFARQVRDLAMLRREEE